MGPPPKGTERKTLVERAGEVHKPTASKVRTGSSHHYATSLNGASRNTSLSSSTSRTHSSASNRTTSNSSYSSSVGPGARPPSASSYRSNTGFGHSKFQKTAQSRPASSLEPHNEEPETNQVLGKRKGRMPISSNPPMCPLDIHTPRMRRFSPGKEHRVRHVQSLRDISLARRLDQLSLVDNVHDCAPPVELKPAQTPSSIPRVVPSPSKDVQTSPSRSPKKMKSQPVFLNKETNVTTAWNIDDRVEEFDDMQRKFTEGIMAKMAEREGLQETVAMYKAQSTLAPAFSV